MSNGMCGPWYSLAAMGAEDQRPDPIEEARRTTRRFWLLQWTRVPDFAEAASGWATLPRAGKWTVVLLITSLIMLVPVIAIAVALMD